MAPILVHHMAAPHNPYLPNSMEAIRSCILANAACIEVDIAALADRDYLLVHDLDLDEETTGQGKVSQLAATQVTGLRYRDSAGRPTAFAVPRLSQVVVALLASENRGSQLQLDFKNVTPFGSDEPLRRLATLIAPLGDRVIVSSCADWQLRRLRQLAPSLQLGFDIQYYLDYRASDEPSNPYTPPLRRGVYGYHDDHPLALSRWGSAREYLEERSAAIFQLAAGCSTLYLNHQLVLRSLDDGFNWAEACHRAGFRLDVWTVNVTNESHRVAVQRLRDAGVDMITTNTPAAVAGCLRLPASA